MGASIVAVRIKGILHEFSTIPGVTEDVTDIIFNLKEVRLRLNDGEQQTLKIDAKGPGTRAGQRYRRCPPAVEILNPDHKIATLSRDAKLEMEMIVKARSRLCAGGTQQRRRRAGGYDFYRRGFFADPKGEF